MVFVYLVSQFGKIGASKRDVLFVADTLLRESIRHMSS
jgi:hypothetical protein